MFFEYIFLFQFKNIYLQLKINEFETINQAFYTLFASLSCKIFLKSFLILDFMISGAWVISRTDIISHCLLYILVFKNSMERSVSSLRLRICSVLFLILSIIYICSLKYRGIGGGGGNYGFSIVLSLEFYSIVFPF